MKNNGVGSFEVNPQNTQHIYRLSDSRFHEQIHRSITHRTPLEIAINSLLYINLVTFLSIALAAFGLGIKATACYLAAAYFIILSCSVIELKLSPLIPSFRPGLYTLVWLLEDSTVALSLVVNAISEQHAIPVMAIACTGIITFLSVPVSSQPFNNFLLGKGLILISCLSYAIYFGDSQTKNIVVIFPLMLTFLLMSAIAYWLYIRQVRMLHQHHEHLHLKDIIHNKNLDLSKAIFAEKKTSHELENAHKLREKIISHISHDLRQPINTINYAIFNMEKKSLTDTQLNQLAITAESIDSANYLIDEILQVSTYKKTNITSNIERFTIHSLLSTIAREFHVAAQQVNCELHIVKCTLSVESDFRLLCRIIKNFLSNAIRYAPGSKILIGARRRDNLVEIQVIDQGDGIPKEIKDKMFEEFTQGGNAKHHNGFGLGLSIAKHLAKVCGGEVNIHSVVHQGTTCTLTLPYKKPDDLA